jgi:hypothetical protein
MAVRFTPDQTPKRRHRRQHTRTADTHDDTLKVRISCDRCDWRKGIVRDKAVRSLRGHYGYAHPERRPPEPRECEARITPWAAR